MIFNKTAISKMLLVFGALGILDTLVLLLFGVGIDLGIVLPGIIGFIFLMIGYLRIRYNIDLINMRDRMLKSVMILLFTIWFISFVLIEGIIIVSQLSDEEKSVDYLLILGAGLKGEKLSLTLNSRMNTGLEYLRSHPGTKVIVSGGMGIGEDITEAEAMKRFLIENKIDNNRIIKEEKSTSTMENLLYSRSIFIKGGGKNEIMIVTSEYHMFRAKLLAKRVGLAPYGLPARTPVTILPNSYLREYFAVLKSLVLDRQSVT